MPKIKINDVEYEGKDGATILDVARANGIDIPYMCYHPGMEVVAVCRVCQVEVKGMPKLQTACSLPIRDGMEVLTESAQARKARAGTVEFWLVNHPLDCPICDKGGECPLQDVTYNVRGGGSRVRDPKVNRPKRKVLGEHIVFDVERCIICWRCTRFTQDISGSEQLMLTQRGVKTEIDTPPGVTLTDPFSGNLADVCPVGALTTREFRFKSRPWEMTPVESTCTACSVGCSLTVWSKRGVIQRLTARENLDVNDYWLCDRGRFDTAFVNAADRLRLPTGPGSTAGDHSYSWDEAAYAFAALIGGRDGESAPASWGVVASPHLTNEEYFALQRFTSERLRDAHTVLDSGPGGPAWSAARAEWHASGRQVSAIRDLDAADLVIQVGQNLEASHPVYSLRLRKAVRAAGARLVIGSTAPGGLDRDAALRVALEPGGEAGFLARLSGGAGDDPVRWLRDLLTTAKRGVLILNAGTANESLLAAARKLLDQNPAGMKLLILDDGPNLAGAWDMGFAAGGGRSRAELLAGIASGVVEGLVLYNSGRPFGWSADVREAAAKAKTLIVMNLAPGEFDSRARLVIPTPSFAEVDGTMTTPDRRVQLIRRAVPGPDGLWHPAAFLARVDRLAGGTGRSGQPVDVFRDISRSREGYAELNFGLLRPNGRSVGNEGRASAASRVATTTGGGATGES